MAVIDWPEAKLKGIVGKAEEPILHELVIALARKGDVEFDPAKFMGNTIEIENILTGFGGIAEPISEVPSKPTAVAFARNRAPIPGVFIGPNTPPPV